MLYTVTVEKDICFTTAFVNYNEGSGPFEPRSLYLDVYKPEGLEAPTGALIMAFGGAFHRGTKEDDRRHEEEPVNTNTAEYCRRFAALGFVCFSID